MRRPIVGLIPYDVNGTRKKYMPLGYLEGVESAGCEPYIIDYDAFELDKIDELAHMLDGMLFTGGVDVDPARYGETKWAQTGRLIPNRDRLEAALFKSFFPLNKPILGICRGQQTINVCMGGTLVQDVPTVYGTLHQQPPGNPFWHKIHIKPGSRVAEIFGATEFVTDSYHHQSVARVADGLEVVARADDGVIEALEMPGERFLVCLQWHPEKTLGIDSFSIKPFEALRAAIKM